MNKEQIDRLSKRLLEKAMATKSLTAAKTIIDVILTIQNDNDICELVFDGYEHNRLIDVIKELRSQFNIGLKEAKDITGQPGFVLAKGIVATQGQQIANILRKAGAAITVR